MPIDDEVPDFEHMSDEELVLFLDQLREKNAKNQPRTGAKQRLAAPKPKKDFIKVDL